MTELMVLVERAVRPVRAASGRKARMREELLAHLTAIYEEERAKIADDALALQQATRRFGDPAELTRELQASVPQWERWVAEPVIGTRTARWLDAVMIGRNPNELLAKPGESPARHAVRVAARCTAFVFLTGLAAGVLATAFAAIEGKGMIRPDRGMGILAVLSGYTFVAVWLCVRCVRAVAEGHRPGPVAQAAAFAAAFILSGAAIFPVLRELQSDNPLWCYLTESPERWGAATAVAVSWVAFPLAVLWATLRYDLPKGKWAALEIGD